MILHREKGFSLVEILIIVAIIAVVAAIGIPNLLGALQRSKRSRAMAEIKAITSSLASAGKKAVSALTDGEDIPVSDVLTPDIYNGSTKDPWGGDYLFSFNSEKSEFIIKSLGKDKVAGATSGEFDSDIIYKNGQFTAPASVMGK